MFINSVLSVLFEIRMVFRPLAVSLSLQYVGPTYGILYLWKWLRKNMFSRLAERLIKFDDVSSVLGKIDSRGEKKTWTIKQNTRSYAHARARRFTRSYQRQGKRTLNLFEEI